MKKKLLGLLGLFLQCQFFAAAAETVAIPANEFLNSIGVCSAVSRRGEKLASTIEAAKYTGIRWFRVGYESGIPIPDLLELHRQTGVRFSYGLMSGGNDPTKGESPIDTLSKASSVTVTLTDHPVVVELSSE
jgi:hypothetical protein